MPSRLIAAPSDGRFEIPGGPLEDRSPPADSFLVRSRTALSIGLTLAALIVGGWRLALPFGGGETSPAITGLIGELVQKHDQTQLPAFQAVLPTLAAYRAAHGTYVGAVLPPSSGVLVVAAGPRSYCLEAREAGSLVHEVEPGGGLATGACPA